MVVGQYRAYIEEVSEAANPQGQSQANAVGYATTKEADTSKGRVESCVSIVDDMCVDQTTSAKAIDSVEHAGAEEADESNEADLEGRRGVMRQCDRSKLDLPVHPGFAPNGRRCFDGAIGGVFSRRVCAGSGGIHRFLVASLRHDFR